MESKTFKVPNIGCDGCVRTVQSELKQIAGVQRVEGAVDTKIVTVEWVDPANWEQIAQALTEIDYPPA
jgi:copper chaperone